MLILQNSQIFIIGILAYLIHELGHITAMKLKKHQIKEIKVSLFSIDIVDKSRNIVTYENDLFILAFGPLFNFIAAFISLLSFYFFHFSTLKICSCVNFSIGIFNLLPIFSLDGGQIVYIILSKYFSYKFSNKLLIIISILFLFPLSVLAILILLKSRYNFSLLFVCLYLFAALIIKN